MDVSSTSGARAASSAPPFHHSSPSGTSPSSSKIPSLDLDCMITATPSIIDQVMNYRADGGRFSGDIRDIESSLSSMTLKGGGKQLSTSRLLVIHLALGLALFLATTDVHLVATSLPTISADLRGSSDLYAWVGVAYVLPQTVFQPLWGKVADISGRKPVLYFSILLFLLGSVLCGVAQNMMWLVISRGVSGAGAGGLVSMVWLIAGEIVPAEQKGKWGNMLSFVWAASALAGPLLGGVFSQLISWRWGFFVNAPICVFSVVLLLVFLREDRTKELNGASRKDYLLDLNWLGLGLLVSGTSTLLLGFSSASSSDWGTPKTIALLTTGLLALVAGCIQDYVYTTPLKSGRLIPRALYTLSGSILSVGSFFQTFTFTAATFYLALFFQAVTGASAIEAGLLLLPFSLGSALISLFANWYMSRGQPKNMVVIGLGVASLGVGLMAILNERSNRALQLALPLIAGLGMGLLFKSPFNALEKTIEPKDRAAMTGCFFYVRFIGTSVGLSVAGAIFDTRIKATAPAGFVINPQSMDWRSLIHIQDAVLRAEVLSCVSKAVSLIWVLCAPLLGISCLLSFLIATGSTVAQTITPTLDIEKQAVVNSEKLGDAKTNTTQTKTSPAPTVFSISPSPSTVTLHYSEERSPKSAGVKVDGERDIASPAPTIAPSPVSTSTTSLPISAEHSRTKEDDVTTQATLTAIAYVSPSLDKEPI
ncbi:hypothetical protein FRB94_008997 [Tulasnella sp. JGI-2019a]|nr:hypothetical protein FRB93_003474 [Tulasnella sp. JGI-2019a]KAG9014839.1 hypothetical protein FRB94_008997 [Tulasnella sp. JGI-2019a]KAG9040001.1 hypothetical protein FRB95_004473 [Tulasnella sp. JGI-2019a]